MDIVRLSAQDHAMLCARFGEHGNSHRRMRDALAETSAGPDALARLRLLRQIERTLDVDLGSVCWRWEHRADPSTHPLEHGIMSYIAEERGAGGDQELWIRLDRVRQLRELMEGRLVGERE